MFVAAFKSSVIKNIVLRIIIMTLVFGVAGGVPASQAESDRPRVPVLSDAEAWKLLPQASKGSGQPLPSWARMMASNLPRTTAAFLHLDLAQRMKSPIPPALRAAMRWIAADVNHCDYAQAYAVADARRIGVDEAKLKGLGEKGYPGWSAPEQAALEFARKMSADSDSVTDPEFAELVKHFGEKQAASMVLLMAYSNYQDRLLLCLGAPMESGGPLPPVDVSFPPQAFVVETTPPPPLNKAPLPEPTGKDLVPDGPEWKLLSYDLLQEKLEAQRQKPTRLRVPEWDEVARNLPEGLMRRPSDIVWYRIVFGYAPELAVPFEIVMRTAGAEGSSKWDRIFGSGLFWVTTKAVKWRDSQKRTLPNAAGYWRAMTGPASPPPNNTRSLSLAS
jgi:alkylhydroperoxidase family enzyme